MNITWVGSPNYTPGREGHAIDHIVIHWMDGHLADADATFQDKQRQTSAHYGVQDDVIHQWVHESDTAWHSGNWAMNLRSIGIEHSAQPGRNASQLTMENSAHLIADICKRFNIPCDRQHIIKHSEVVPDECPGTVDIDWLVKRAAELLNASKEKNLMTEKGLQALYRYYYGKDVDAAAVSANVGRPVDDVIADIEKAQAYATREQMAKDGTLDIMAHLPPELRGAKNFNATDVSNIAKLTGASESEVAGKVDWRDIYNAILAPRIAKLESEAAASGDAQKMQKVKDLVGQLEQLVS